MTTHREPEGAGRASTIQTAPNLQLFIAKIGYLNWISKWMSHEEEQDHNSLVFTNCKLQPQITFRDTESGGKKKKESNIFMFLWNFKSNKQQKGFAAMPKSS